MAKNAGRINPQIGSGYRMLEKEMRGFLALA